LSASAVVAKRKISKPIARDVLSPAEPKERGCVVFNQPPRAGNFLCIGTSDALRLVPDTAALHGRRKIFASMTDFRRCDLIVPWIFSN
jgi:hypothetical protein